jgi:hypothetical protein
VGVGIFKSATASAVLFALGASAAVAQALTIKGGQSVDAGAVYWIENCQTRLVGFAGVTVTSAPPGVSVSLRKKDVKAVRQNCPNLVPGATVVITAPVVTQPVKGIVKYQVAYLVADGGRRTGDYSREITIVP